MGASLLALAKSIYYFVSLFVIAFPLHHVSLPAIYILNMDEQC